MNLNTMLGDWFEYVKERFVKNASDFWFSNANFTLREKRKKLAGGKNKYAQKPTIVASSFSTDEFLPFIPSAFECRVKYMQSKHDLFRNYLFMSSFAKLYFNCKYTINVDGNKKRSKIKNDEKGVE